MITLEEAILYFNEERLFGDTFINAEENIQTQALKMVTNQINCLKFNNYKDDEKENNIKKAICEQAIYLLETKNTQRAKMIEQGVTSFSVEGLTESYNTVTFDKKICNDSMQFIKPYLLGSAEIC